MASFYLKIQNAEIAYKNFRGIETDKNNAGSRNFAVILKPEDEFQIDVYENGNRDSFIGNVQTLIEQGWNIREHTRKTPDGMREPTGNYILSSVKINFYPEKYAPSIRYYASPEAKSFVMLTEELLNPDGALGRQIDENGFVRCDLCLRGYNDKPGHVSAFVSQMAIVGKPSIFDEWGYDSGYEE